MIERCCDDGELKLNGKQAMECVDTSGAFRDLLVRWNIDIDAEEYFLLPLVLKEEL
ncbi:MAG: hypothetical protein ACE5DM_02600 [Candidatus Nanoarchaeia archaeon]